MLYITELVQEPSFITFQPIYDDERTSVCIGSMTLRSMLLSPILTCLVD